MYLEGTFKRNSELLQQERIAKLFLFLSCFWHNKITLLKKMIVKIILWVSFLVLLLLSVILIFGNAQYISDFYFLSPFEQTSLSRAFAYFTILGGIIGILFVFSLNALFSKKPTLDKSEENTEE